MVKEKYDITINRNIMRKLKNMASALLLLASLIGSAQSESFYVDWLNNHEFRGQTEVMLPNGRADIVNSVYAIEVEWASNWKHSIGQALWYGLQTNRKPGIVLIMKDISERKYGVMLQSALDYASITDKIQVWFYPEDFGQTFGDVEIETNTYRQNLIQEHGHFTCNKNSGVRHNSGCTYFNCPNCVPCGPDDGKKACGKCGG